MMHMDHRLHTCKNVLSDHIFDIILEYEWTTQMRFKNFHISLIPPSRYVYLENANKNKYRSLLHTLSQQQSLKNDQNLKTIADATQALCNHNLDNASDKTRSQIKRSNQAKEMGLEMDLEPARTQMYLH